MSEVIEQFKALLKHGPGVHAYALHRAQQLEKEAPWYEGLAAFVERELGAKALAVARRDIQILGVAA